MIKGYKYLWQEFKKYGLFGDVVDSPPPIDPEGRDIPYSFDHIYMYNDMFVEPLINRLEDSEKFFDWIEYLKIKRLEIIPVPDFTPMIQKVDAIVEEMRTPSTDAEPTRNVLPEEINRAAIKEIINTANVSFENVIKEYRNTSIGDKDVFDPSTSKIVVPMGIPNNTTSYNEVQNVINDRRILETASQGK